MNRARRDIIRRALVVLEEINVTVEGVKEEEEAAFDNMPESLQESERALAMGECLASLEEVLDSLTTAIETLGEIANA